MLARIACACAALFLGAASGFACTGPDSVRIDSVYPSGPRVPQNLLRMYLYFSAPMAESDVLSQITLIQSDGTVVDGVFLSNRFDLWSPDRRRLTLLLDPGRVKTGLAAHDALGRALVPGERYTLRVGTGLRDAKGCAIDGPFSVVFNVEEADVMSPDPEAWNIEPPRTGGRDPVRIDLKTPHDHLSLVYRIRVRSGDGEIVRGRISLLDDETVWAFVF